MILIEKLSSEVGWCPSLG